MVKDLVPRIHFYDQDFVDMYDRTWVWIDEIWHQGEKDGLFPEGYLTHADSPVISLFDSSLSALFLVYSNQNYSPYSMIDFFYSVQGEDGQIAEKYDIASKTPVFDSSNPLGASLPLLSYVEFVFYHKIGNKKRLKDVVPFLEKYFAWIQKNFMDKVWTEDNTNAYFPRAMAYSTTSGPMSKVNDRYIQNLRYLRFKNLTVGYTIPQEFTRQWKVEKLRFYIAAENLCELINNSYVPIDPEIDTSDSSTANNNGTWGRVAPMQRTISFGLQLTL